MSILNNISIALQKGKSKDVVQLIHEALDSGITAQEILDNGLLKGMGELGVKFKNNEVYVPEVLIAARALNSGTMVLKAKLVEEGVQPIGTVVIGTVKGDLHDIGKNLVKMMLEGAGFAVIDLGVDVPEERIVEAITEHEPNIVCLSALLTTTMNQQKVVIEALKEAGLRDKVKVMIGGAPVTQSFCDQIGADVYTPDAATAAEVAKSFVLQH
ncbi:corrinoid protein [Hydrogenoanaerobacterium sp.]|uniref:corrinoid protein n=1 Tax=Hydrogenoanaerobacterium sp. TaxID=2953763 RepID=UPI0028A2A85C|nr:corrinoid protein [Hydrogenoanaerobacterium sp.]